MLVTDLPINTQCFMQDGSTPHTSNFVLDLLNSVFEHRVISNLCPGHHNRGFFWSPLSLDLNPCYLSTCRQTSTAINISANCFL